MKEETKNYLIKLLENKIDTLKREINKRNDLRIHEEYKDKHKKVFGCTFEEHIEWICKMDNKDYNRIVEYKMMINELREE